MQEYILMHKQIPVAEITIDEISGSIATVGTVYAECHLPVGIPVKKHVPDRASLNSWWQGGQSRQAVWESGVRWKN